ncbi:hypothetical protein HKD37_02G004184 [Glycine soja]
MLLIMVRTRGLGRALGKRRRPIAPTRRQRETAPVAKDVDNMDHANEEVHELPEEVACVDVPTNVEGFLKLHFCDLMLNPTQFQAKEEKAKAADDSLSETDSLSEMHPLSEASSSLSG